MAGAITLTQDYETAVSDADLHWLRQWRWYACVSGSGRPYARRSQDGVYMHRLLMSAPAHLVVDHRDNDSLNNTRANLRVTTVNRNTQWSLRCSAVSGYLGVQRRSIKGGYRYRVRLSDGGTERNLGTFGCPIEAARAYDRAAIAAHGPFAATNFPPTDYDPTLDLGERPYEPPPHP